MYSGGLFLILFIPSQMVGSQSQECVSRQDIQSTLQHVHKLLSVHETSFLQSVRSLRKKLNLLYNSTVKHSSNFSTDKNSTQMCLPPNPPANGRMLGQVYRVGHEVHFLCNPGFQLTGPETRECLDSLRWSGEEPNCQRADAEPHDNTTSSFLSTSSSSPPLSSAYVRPSRCVKFRGSTHCKCQQGYSISSQDRSLCTDIDECETGAHDCTKDHVCVNTFGGHRCVSVECPPFRNASYIKTSPLQCERNPCVQGNKACLQAPVSISFHFMSVVSNMSTPRLLFRVSAARLLGDALRFGLLRNRGVGHFTVQRSSKQSGDLLLVEPVEGPATLEAEVEMSELERRTLLGRYVTKITLFVSPYSF